MVDPRDTPPPCGYIKPAVRRADGSSPRQDHVSKSSPLSDSPSSALPLDAVLSLRRAAVSHDRSHCSHVPARAASFSNTTRIATSPPRSPSAGSSSTSSKVECPTHAKLCDDGGGTAKCACQASPTHLRGDTDGSHIILRRAY